MAYPIRTAEVRRVFAPVLGTQLTAHTSLREHVAEKLRHHRPDRSAPEELCRGLKEIIFGDLYELLTDEDAVAFLGSRRRTAGSASD